MEVTQWLDTDLGRDIWNNKYRHKGESLDDWFKRVSGGNKEVEKLIREKKFMFGGRATTNRGTGNNASYSNCYSHGYMPDSLDGIMGLNRNIAMTFKSQGGQGVSLSNVRPKGTPVGNGSFVSDGIIPFMEIANTTTASVSQGGSRKGALMMSLSCEHKEIIDFITIKSNTGKIEKANLSVEVTDEFMESVDVYYETGEEIELNYVKHYGEHVVEYSLKPIEIYKAMMLQAYDNAEPGVIYTKRFRNYNLMQFIEAYQIVTGNPCGGLRLM